MIERVLHDLSEDLPRLERYGAAVPVERFAEALQEIRGELDEFLTWHDEAGAVLLSDKPAGFFKARFAGWAARGLAKQEGRRRFYRQAVIPLKPDLAGLREDARRTALAELQHSRGSAA